METERRPLAETSLELPVAGIHASNAFDVTGKESQTSRATLVRAAVARGTDFFATSPAFGEAARILAAGLIEVRYRSTVMVTIQTPDVAAAYQELDLALHLFDRRVEILVADWEAASSDLLTSLARMRSVGEATAIGVACKSIEALAAATRRIVPEGLDVIVLPATLLVSEQVHRLFDDVVARSCGIITYLPDGLENVRGEALGEMKVNPQRHALESVGDVLFKYALSDERITSAVAPARRIRDLDRLETIASLPPFSATEMDALRTG